MTDTKAVKVQEENLLHSNQALARSQKKGNCFTRTLKSCCIIPQRYVLGIMGLMGMCNAYTMRICLNMAITQMVHPHIKNDSVLHNEPEACPNEVIENIGNETVIINRPYAIFDWDEETQGFILSGFYYGYITTQFLSGYLSQRYGAKWVLGLGLLSTALFTFLTPVVTRAGGGKWLFALRVLQGMGEGPTMPALMAMLARWVPPLERSFQGALVFGGAQIGNIVGSLISGFLLNGRDWAYVFYVFGSFGIIWFILWSFLCYSTPSTHPFITEKELIFLKENVLSAEKKSVKDPVPWKAIFRSPPIWAIMFASIGHDWGFYTMITDLPKYSHDVLKFNIKTTGTLTSLPYVAMWIFSFLFGFVCDFCIKKNWHSIKTARLIYTTIAATGPAICIILASYSGCNRVAAMVYFILSMALMGAFYSGMRINVLDIAPNYAGSVTSFLNTMATFAGILSPYLTGVLTPESTLDQWRVVFWVCFAVLVGTNVVYCIWADGKQQWWDDIHQYGYPSDWKHGLILKEKPQYESVKVSNEKL